MEYSIFCESVKDEIQRMMGEDYKVRLENVVKNNQVSYNALIIMAKDKQMAPSIYLEGYYDEYTEGKNITDIALDVIVQYEQYKEGISFDIRRFSNYEIIKNDVYVKVINTAMNRRTLNNMPCLNYYDLSMIVYVICETDESCSATINVTDAHMKLWGVDRDTLFKDAINNTRKRLKPRVDKMSDMMKELLMEKLTTYNYRVGEDESFDKELGEILDNIDQYDEDKTYVLTNERKLHGAVYMLFSDVLEKIANDIDDDMFILPSSIHEIIIIPQKHGVEIQELREMVKSVNESELDPKEILSDTVYVYERGKGIVWENA